MSRKTQTKSSTLAPNTKSNVHIIDVKVCKYREDATKAKWPRGPLEARGVVIHRIDVGDTPQKIIDAFLDGEAGSYTGHAVPYHFVIGKDGTIHQLLPLDVKGQHARGENSKKHGVALDGDFRMRPPTPAQLESAVQICTYLRIHYGGRLIRHDETPLATQGKICPGRHLDVEAMQAEVLKRSRQFRDWMLSSLWLAAPV